MKRIIVEGPDGSGKTTLIELLKDTFPVEVVRNNLEDKQNFDRWWPDTLRQTFPYRIPIHDRFFYSELVYGTVLRGKVNATPETVRVVSTTLKQEAFLIYCRPPFDVIQENVNKNPQMAGVVDHLMEIVDGYDALFGLRVAPEYGDRFMMYNWTDDAANRELGKMLAMYIGGLIN